MEERAEAKARQFPLLTERRFGPLWICHFTNQLNNQFLRAATLWILSGNSYVVFGEAPLQAEAMAWFVLPAIVTAAIGGQLADHMDRQKVIILAQTVGLVAAALAVFGLLADRTILVLAGVAVAGVQTTIFSPAQGALIRQHLADTELTPGNGLMTAGRQLATITGLLLLLATFDPETEASKVLLPALVASAVAGWLVSLRVPRSPAPRPDMKTSWTPLGALRQTLVEAVSDRNVFLAILGVSWFWFTHLVFLVNLPSYAANVIGARDLALIVLLMTPVATLMLGALLCQPASGRRVELGLVPLGALGMAIAGVDFYLNSPEAAPAAARTLKELLDAPTYVRCLVDLAIFGLSAGLYVVPLYALVQQSAPTDRLGRILGGMMFYNLIFVSLALAGAQWLRSEGLSLEAIILTAILLQSGVAIYIFLLLPEFLLRLLMWLLVHTIYRTEATHLERVPPSGPAVIVCNHVSYMDPLVIGAKVRRPVRFVMHRYIFQIPVMKTVFRLAKAIPIVSGKKDPEGLQRAMDQVAAELDAGRLVAIFPEGMLTRDGDIGIFRSGIERIIERNPVPVIPMGLSGLWGSFFSFYGGEPMKHVPRLKWSRIRLRVGKPIPPTEVTVDLLRERVAELRGPHR
jgi:1-acyl-sn-glycerol-3-phosphate acyltransferase